MKVVAIALVLCVLSACACPRTAPYDGIPYGAERTAGRGMVDEGCAKRLVDHP